MKLYTHILCMCLTPKARAQTHWPMRTTAYPTRNIAKLWNGWWTWANLINCMHNSIYSKVLPFAMLLATTTNEPGTFFLSCLGYVVCQYDMVYLVEYIRWVLNWIEGGPWFHNFDRYTAIHPLGSLRMVFIRCPRPLHTNRIFKLWIWH